MTLPDERYNALMAGSGLLRELANPKLTPRVPKYIRDRVNAILRHHPDYWLLCKLPEALPEYFQDNIEPVKRLIMKYEEGLKKDE